MSDEVEVRTVAFGDSGVLVEPGGTADPLSPEDKWVFVHNLGKWLVGTEIPGVVGAVPTYDRVLVEFDPVETDHRTITAFVRAWTALTGTRALEPASPGRKFCIPVLYGGKNGPDLEEAAAQSEVEVEELVNLHVNLVHPIRCLAQAGAPMLDGPDLPREVERRTDPRVRVPGGSVMLAGAQAIILPAESPSGWQIIARTPVSLIDHRRADLLMYRPGDIFTYRRIDDGEWDLLEGRPLEEFRV